jgi:hypothetical protein
MILLMVVPSSAAFFLKALCVSLEIRIMMFLSFFIATPMYSLLYIIIHWVLGFVKPDREAMLSTRRVRLMREVWFSSILFCRFFLFIQKTCSTITWRWFSHATWIEQMPERV